MNDRNLSVQGFTIIETMMAIAVFTLIWGALMSMIVLIYRTHGYAMEQSMAVSEARRGVDAMAKELRQARYGDNGAYPIEKAASKEIIFYSDIDDDGQAERVRYYLATVRSKTQTKECISYQQGGGCSVSFNNFYTGTLRSAQVRVSTEGYYGTTSRYSQFRVDGASPINMCLDSEGRSICSECLGAWQDTRTFDVTSALLNKSEKSVQFSLTGTNSVKPRCDWINTDHSLKAQYEFSFTEEIPNMGHELRRGVTEPSGSPVAYPSNQEQASVITSYVRNAPPIFTYFDKNGIQITDDPSILRDTKMVRLFMVVNINVNRAPDDYDLEQYVQIRSLKEE